MINLHYELNICQKIYNRVTMTVYVKCVVRFNVHHTLCSNGQIYAGDFEKFCGLLRIYMNFTLMGHGPQMFFQPKICIKYRKHGSSSFSHTFNCVCVSLFLISNYFFKQKLPLFIALYHLNY